MNIVFIGASGFGLRCLEASRKIQDLTVTGVVTAPSKFKISYQPKGVHNILHADVGSYCNNNNIPFTTIKDGMMGNELFEKIKTWNPDMFLVSGWYHMIPKRWLNFAATYGMHASLLPDYSGGAPLVWAIINGESKTGISLFQFDQGVDSGPVIGQLSVEILEEDTIATLYSRIEEKGLDLLHEYLPKIAKGTVAKHIQDERNRRIYPQRSPEDGHINWQQSTRQIYDFIRAQTKPYPGAYCYFNGKKMIIWKTETPNYEDKFRSKPGKIQSISSTMGIGTGNGIIKLRNISIDGNDYNKHELLENFGSIIDKSVVN
jgi:methionyl-tRNA formyltransferase